MPDVRRGRPRSEATKRAVLEATRDLILESGYGELTMQGIAARAGAGKQTIYRWWPAKSFIVADVVAEGYLRMPASAVPETISLEADLRAWIAATAGVLGDPGAGSILRALVNAASDDTAEATNLYTQLTGPNHEAIVRRLQRGLDAGQLDPSTDVQAIADALVGTAFFGVMARFPIGDRLTAVLDALLRGSAPS